MSVQDEKIDALIAAKSKMNTSEQAWADRMLYRYESGPALTMREWERIVDFTATVNAR